MANHESLLSRPGPHGYLRGHAEWTPHPLLRSISRLMFASLNVTCPSPLSVLQSLTLASFAKACAASLVLPCSLQGSTDAATVPLARSDRTRQACHWHMPSALCRRLPQPRWRRDAPQGSTRCCSGQITIALDENVICCPQSAAALPSRAGHWRRAWHFYEIYNYML